MIELRKGRKVLRKGRRARQLLRSFANSLGALCVRVQSVNEVLV
jgi:hypothetical protein